MTKKISKYFCMFTMTMISLGLFNAGCINQPKKTVNLEPTMDSRMDTLSQSVEVLEPVINKLNEKLDEQVTKIEASLSAQDSARALLEERVSETGNLIREIKQNLVLVEEDKGSMKVQLDELGTQLNRLESISKITSADTNLTEELLDNGIKFYRQQKFEDAISKWEEVLAREPGKLEAKFFIEIAKDRINQNQIHEDLKASLIQRK